MTARSAAAGAETPPPSSPTVRGGSPALFPTPVTPVFNGHDRFLVVNIPNLNRYKAPGAVKPKILLPISISSEYCDPIHMSVLMHTVNEVASEAIIVVVDLLHAYDIQLAREIESLEEAKDIATAEGDTWLEDCDSIFKGCNIPIRIVRWKELLEQEEIEAASKYIASLDVEGSKFRIALRQTVKIFIDRKRKRLKRTFTSEFKTRSQETCNIYLKEEAKTFLLFPKYECDFLVYPNKETPLIHYLRTEILPAYTPLTRQTLQWAEAKFAKADPSKRIDDLLRAALGHIAFTIFQANRLGMTESIRGLDPTVQLLAMQSIAAHLQKQWKTAERTIRANGDTPERILRAISDKVDKNHFHAHAATYSVLPDTPIGGGGAASKASDDTVGKELSAAINETVQTSPLPFGTG